MFFVGNDFLPSLPSCSIKQNGLNYLLDIYKSLLPKLNGQFLTSNHGTINLLPVDLLLSEIATYEVDLILKKNLSKTRKKI